LLSLSERPAGAVHSARSSAQAAGRRKRAREAHSKLNREAQRRAGAPFHDAIIIVAECHSVFYSGTKTKGPYDSAVQNLRLGALQVPASVSESTGI
jgi:hypothetical protein